MAELYDDRKQARHQRSKPLIDALRLWLEAKLAGVSAKVTIADAIRYALSRWDGLTRFLHDGRIEIDSNLVERSIRPIALRRRFLLPMTISPYKSKLVCSRSVDTGRRSRRRSASRRTLSWLKSA